MASGPTSWLLNTHKTYPHHVPLHNRLQGPQWTLHPWKLPVFIVAETDSAAVDSERTVRHSFSDLYQTTHETGPWLSKLVGSTFADI